MKADCTSEVCPCVKLDCFCFRPSVPWFTDAWVTARQLVFAIFIIGIYIWSATGTHLSISELVMGLPVDGGHHWTYVATEF